jgi:RNA polymerase sigma-70 factor, ECF subfamily
VSAEERSPSDTSTSESIEAAAQAAFAAGNFEIVTETALRAYGDEIYSFILAQFHGNLGAADDAFSEFSEDLWRGLPAFQWRCTLRAWSYRLARSACSHYRRSPYNRAERRAPIGVSEIVDHLGQQARSSTQVHLRTDVKDKVRELREQLSPSDRDLLILRVDRGLSWREVVFALHGEEDPPANADLPRLEANVRQHFADIKKHLRDLAKAAGLL